MTNFEFTATSDQQKVEMIDSLLELGCCEVAEHLRSARREFKAAALLDSHTSRLRGRQHLLNTVLAIPRDHHLQSTLRLLMS